VLRDVAPRVLSDYELPLVEAIGEAAFYGPKLDLQVRDSRGHEETIATVQLDFNQPERFDLTYQAADGAAARVVMIHRGTVGAMERVVASLLERHQGRLPFWLSPVQLIVLPVSEAQDAPARAAVDLLRAHGLRVNLVVEGTLGSRIRDAHRQRIPLVAVIGEREVSDNKVQVTDAAHGSRHVLSTEALADTACTAHRERSPIQW
jgi:threonyl-tRNA synthetase